ncbi:MAG: iron donor protein CyaY [Alphaproteobacteria bacterium]|nr:iron donor protein CyaY [Alphaproteobacteria bacterium]OJV13176.1 MAG: iron donor protein CyaY [Alphaproteobacteria bacterium 33-17]
MNTAEFDKIASKLIAEISDKCDEYELDSDCNNGVLYIETDSGTYVINKHAPTMQIWLSSPVSGAKHFVLSDSAWICTKTNVKLLEIIEKELF